MTAARCLQCGLDSDDPVELAGHANGHHKVGCQCGTCTVVYGDKGRPRSAVVVDLGPAYEVWLEGSAA